MTKLLAILLFLVITSCNSSNKQWKDLKNNNFLNTFKFAYSNRESVYLDSALIILNDSLSHNKDFWMWIHDDTIEYRKFDPSFVYKIPKENIILFNVNTNTLKYIDSCHTSLPVIDSLIQNFIHKIEWGGFYIYSDTLANKDDWRKLFSTIDKTVVAYNTERERYSLNQYGLEYKNIADSIKTKIINKIRMSIVVYFRNPFPPPPPLTEKELKRIFENLDMTKE